MYIRPVAILCTALALAAPALSQVADQPGVLYAVTCGTLPRNPAIDIIVLDNTDQNIRIRDAVAARLERRGIRIVNGAALTMTLDIQTVREFEERKPGTIIELRAGQENTDIGERGTVELRGSVWSNQNDSLIGGRRTTPGTLAVNRVRITASVNQRTDGVCLWQGEVVHDLDGDEVEQVAMRLVPRLTGAFGKSVPSKRFTVRPPPRVR